MDGWEDDDDLDFSATDAADETADHGSGWDDHDDDLNLDDNDDNAFGAGYAVSDSKIVPDIPQEENGWEEDVDLSHLDDDDDLKDANEADGWGDDDDDFNFDDDENETSTPQEVDESPKLRQELEDYVDSLGRIMSSINAVLEFEYNTPEKAQELVEYYTQRPGLAEYTRTKELSRMNYQVVLPGKVVTSKEEIAEHHLPDDSLLARCANQSLLADLIQVLTGPDLVVRPQFFAVCVAQTCQFRLHMGDQGRDMVQCNCILQLSFPKEDGSRINVATIRTTIVFSPLQHLIKFKVDKIIVTLKDKSKLDDVVSFLKMMKLEDPSAMDVSMQVEDGPSDRYRDLFLMMNAQQQQTQKFVQQSKVGMKSALNDMESVLGLKSKFKAVQGGISKFLPNTDDLLAVQEEEARAHRQQVQQGPTDRAFPVPPRPMPGPSVHEAHTGPPPIGHHRHPAPPPPQGQGPPMAQPPPNDGPRPKSILGGLVSALAKSVTLPDEDPDIYGSESGNVPTQPSLYRKDVAPPALAPPIPKESMFPRPTPPPVEQVPRPGHSMVGLASQPGPSPEQEIITVDDSGDGWDDDLDLDITTDVVADSLSPEQEPEAAVPSLQNMQLAATESTETEMFKKPSGDDVVPETDEENEAAPETQKDFDWGADDPVVDESENDGTVEDQGDNDETQANGDYDWNTSGREVDESETNTDEGFRNEKIVPETDDEAPDSPRQHELIDLTKIEENGGLTVNESVVDASARTMTKDAPQSNMQLVNPIPQDRDLIVDIPYDPEDDIIPTRKRWNNPRPNRPYLRV